MRGRLWLTYLANLMNQTYQKSDQLHSKQWGDSDWTRFLGEVMECVAERMGCYVVQRRSEPKSDSYEYLNIDAMFFDNAEYDIVNDANAEYDPFVLPRAVVELENNYDFQKISYCLWKILCVRSSIRVLVCYQNSREKSKRLKRHLEEVIWQGSLMKGTDGDLLILIGDDSKKNENVSWEDYYTAYEWRGDRLLTVRGLEWPDTSKLPEPGPDS